MAGSHGSLAHLRLTALLRLVAGLGQTATVVAENGPWTLRIWFEQGRLVRAVRSPDVDLDALETAEYLFPNGHFVVSDGEPTPEATIDLSADELNRCLDEYATQRAELTRSIPSLCSVPRLAGVTAGELDSMSLSCLRMIDGRRTVGAVIGTERPVPRLRALATMVQLGLVEFGDRRPASPPPTSPPTHVSAPAVAVEPADAAAELARTRAGDRSGRLAGGEL
jgi:hypothetical protein